MTRPALAEVRGLAKRYGRTRALDGASFSVPRGAVLGLIGPNGSGKTTLFECLAGLVPADAGVVLSGGAAVPPAARKELLFYVPDGISPWPDQRVGWLLGFFARLYGAAAGARARVEAELGLGELLGARVGELSKGQRKRVLLALGLLSPRPLLLLDEPFDGLDLRQTRDVATVLRRHAGGGRTLFLSIHQLADAARVCDRLVLLSAGRVAGEGTLDELRERAGLAGAGLEEVFLALT
ncbi:MAG TPA: ABC transporter ATP-binding protein [Longimicrobiales bacterium]|nr:ABC transporter ATP-binding protein [Longimicrobiales bacterium]